MQLVAVIEVTQDRINRAGTGAESCPIALAIRESLGMRSGVSVNSSQITLNGFSLTPPEVAAHFVKTFDNKGRSKSVPISFELVLPADALHLLGRQ